MAKSLFLFTISALMTLLWTPEVLMADDFDLKKLPDFDDVETVIEVKPVEVIEPVQPVVTQAVSTPRVETMTRPVAQPAVQTAPVYSNSFSINGRNLELVDVASPAVNAGNHVNRYNKMFYGHNSAGVFAGIGSAGEFSVTENGVTTRYRVMEQHTFEKYSATHLSLDGQVYSMASLANRAWGYDAIVVTCAGTSLGNGDATHRLMLFANKI
ncbi:hypothetical protein IKD98_04185 [Candidatus Saccharibacteria bacterium]|nr:hypothetical protein [Candidatus Saccharibacteria bacterium]